MENCDGCLIKCTHYKAYSYKLISKPVLIKCPCSKCLVKMVCLEGCEDFDKYSKMTIGEIRDLEAASKLIGHIYTRELYEGIKNGKL